MRKELIKRYGEVRGADTAAYLFFRHVLTTDTYSDSYQAILLLDDDDGNPATKSPNHCLITKAFSDHGLGKPNGCKDEQKKDLPLDKSLKVAIRQEIVLNLGL